MGRGIWDRLLSLENAVNEPNAASISPAYAGSDGSPPSALVCYGGWIKPWRNADGCPPKPSQRRTCFGGFRRRYQRDHGCKAVGLHNPGKALSMT